MESAPGLTAKKLLLLQSQLEQLQEENFRLESSREDERLRCLELEREVTELQQRNQALTSLSQEAQALKDEMDELRHQHDTLSHAVPLRPTTVSWAYSERPPGCMELPEFTVSLANT